MGFGHADSLTLEDNEEDCAVLRTPLRSLAGHVGVVIAADWLPGGDQAVTAGWDRLACIWDTQTGSNSLNNLTFSKNKSLTSLLGNFVELGLNDLQRREERFQVF
jgi:WD40 repeat protein